MAMSQLANLATGGNPVIVPDSSLNQITVTQVREYTVPELIKELSGHYDVDSTLALDIARCESRLQQFYEDGTLVRGKKNAHDVGVFQINEEYHLERSKTLGFDIYTTAGNIEYAMWLMKREGDRHWRWSQGCWGN